MNRPSNNRGNSPLFSPRDRLQPTSFGIYSNDITYSTSERDANTLECKKAIQRAYPPGERLKNKFQRRSTKESDFLGWLQTGCQPTSRWRVCTPFGGVHFRQQSGEKTHEAWGSFGERTSERTMYRMPSDATATTLHTVFPGRSHAIISSHQVPLCPFRKLLRETGAKRIEEQGESTNRNQRWEVEFFNVYFNPAMGGWHAILPYFGAQILYQTGFILNDWLVDMGPQIGEHSSSGNLKNDR